MAIKLLENISAAQNIPNANLDTPRDRYKPVTLYPVGTGTGEWKITISYSPINSNVYKKLGPIFTTEITNNNPWQLYTWDYDCDSFVAWVSKIEGSASATLWMTQGNSQNLDYILMTEPSARLKVDPTDIPNCSLEYTRDGWVGGMGVLSSYSSLISNYPTNSLVKGIVWAIVGSNDSFAKYTFMSSGWVLESSIGDTGASNVLGSPSNPYPSLAARNAAAPFQNGAIVYVAGSPVPTPYMLANGATGGSDADWIASSFFNSTGSGVFRVRWLDYTGEVVQTLYCNAGTSFAHPVAPTHSGLTFDAWSQDALFITADRDIYANYYATDDKAHLLIEASALAGLTPTIKVAKSDTSTLLIEWGDGTTSTSSATGNVTIAKPAPYAAGSYDIAMSISSGTGTFTGGHGTNGNSLIAGVAVIEMWMRSTSTTVTGYAFNGTAFRTMKYVTGMGGITTIGTYAFQHCYALVSANMPLVTTIGAYAFLSCYALVSANMPLATTIGTYAFPSCSALVSANMPLATTIGAYAFQGCRRLKTVIIGPNCTLIDALAFDGGRNLISLTVQATTPPTLASVATIADYDPRMLIYVPSASVAAYQAATNWSAFASRIVGY